MGLVDEETDELLAAAASLLETARKHMAAFAIHQYVASVFEIVARTNRYFATREPWKKANSDPGEMRVVLYTTLEVLTRIVAILLQPVMPASMNKLLDLLAVSPGKRNFRDLEVWTEHVEVGEPLWRIRAPHRLQPGTLLPPPAPSLSSAISNRSRRSEGLGRRRMTIIDSHCHLDFPDFAGDLDGVVERARAVGVERMITIGTKVTKACAMWPKSPSGTTTFSSLSARSPTRRAAECAGDFAAMRKFASHPKCVGIGEAGLDYHYNYALPEVAKRIFRGQIGLARELGLPLVIHARDADDDIAEILTDEMGQGRFTAVLHCFTSSRELAETALGLGLSISFSGVVTFKKSEGLARYRPRCPARPHSRRDRRALSGARSPIAATATSRPLSSIRRTWSLRRAGSNPRR